MPSRDAPFVLLRGQLWSEFRARIPEERWRECVADLAARRVTPHQAAERLLALAAVGG